MNIVKYNESPLTTIPDGIINTTASSLSLPGRNVAGYGEVLNNNLVHLLENWADNTQPNNPLVGQLWFDTANGKLNVNTQQGFQPLTVTYIDSNSPSNANTGECWWNVATAQLFVNDGANWVLVGPGYEKSWKETGVFPDMVSGVDGINRLVIMIKFADETRMIISQNPEFVPAPAIVGFATIKPGINFSTSITNFSVWATVENSTKLGGFSADNYVRNNVDSTIDGDLTVNQLQVGTSRIYNEKTTTQNNLFIVNDTENSYVTVRTRIDGELTSVLAIAPDGRLELARDPTSPNHAATKNYVDNLKTQTIDMIFDETSGLLGYLQSNLSILNNRIDSNLEQIDDQKDLIVALQGDMTAKANIVSPQFSGNPTVPTPAIGSNNLSIVNTAYVKETDDQTRRYVDDGLASLLNGLTTTSTTLLALKANINSPVFTGKPVLTVNPSTSSNSQEITTTSWVRDYVTTLLDTAEGGISNSLNLKANINSPSFSGTPEAPTPSINSDSLQIANTAWVRDIFDAFAANATWQGSRKYVSTRSPTSSDGNDGDFWFKHQ